MNSNLSLDKFSFLINTSINHDICIYHKEIYESYCITCSKNICKNCIYHFNHDLINLKEIQPKKEEIDLLKITIKKFEEDYNKFIIEIFSWKKILDEMIISFQNQIKEIQRINNDINFCLNNYNYMNINSIIKFRIIYDKIIEPKNNVNNKKILNYIYPNYNKNLEDLFDNEIKIGLFEYNEYNKIKLCLEQIMNKQNNIYNTFLFNSNNIIKILWENSKNNKNNSLLLENNNIIYLNKKKSIIKKYIDLSEYNKIIKSKNKCVINKSREKENINLNKTQTSFNPKNIGNIFLDQNYLNTYNNNSIYCKKRNNSYNNISWSKNQKNISFNINEFNTNLNINKINLFLKKEKTPNNTNNNKIIFDKFIPEIKLENRNKKNKTFIHKKFEPINLKQFFNNNLIPKTPKYSSKSEKNKITEKSGYINNTSDNKLSSTYQDSETIKQKLNFDLSYNEIIKNNEMALLLNNEGEIPNKLSPDKIKYNNNNPDIQIPQLTKTFKYSLDPNQPLYIGLEIGNLNCKLGIINLSQNTNNIFSIPFIVSFNEEKNEIKIGQDSLNYLLINSPKNKNVFNIMTFFGKNFDEVNYNKELYPYEIFSNENKPFIRINFNNKEKIFNFEDLFTIYMKKLFENFFTKIELIDNNNDKAIQLLLTIAIPDNLSYFQRKIIERIFQSQIFPSNKNKLYNGSKVILENIKIINASSLIHLCYKSNDNDDSINKNILGIISEGENINISLSCYYKDKINNEVKDIYEIKNAIDLKKGENYFINDFIEQRIKLKEKVNEYDINDLRNVCYEFILSRNENKNYQDKELLNEFIQMLDRIYVEIISSIENLLEKEKLELTNITKIFIQGQILNTKPFINLISHKFKENTYIELISNHDNNIINGALNLTNNFCVLKNISPISFGIDSLGDMKFLIEKGDKMPFVNNKFIKIKNIKENKYLEIKIYEGENKEINKNRLISCININKKKFKNEIICDDYIELLIQFELEEYCNLRVFMLDPKTTKKRFECLINIDIIKG